MSDGFDIVVLGSLHLDIMVTAPRQPRPGETLTGSAWSRKPGGKGGNQAVEAARHGAAVAMVGRVGADEFGRHLLEHLAGAGVDARAVSVTDGTGSGMSVALVDATGDYAAVIVSGANTSLAASDLAAAQVLLPGARLLLLQNEVPEDINLAAAAGARRAGVPVLLNAAPARPIPTPLRDVLDILVVNAVEAEQLGAQPVAGLEGAVEAAGHLLELAPAVIVTVGGAGLAVAGRAGERFALPAHAVAIASTHGAGDALVGALAARLAAGDALAEAAAYANAAAALAVATPPGQPRPAVRELLQAAPDGAR